MEEKSKTCGRIDEQEKKLTHSQKQYLNAYMALGSGPAVAREFSVDPSAVYESLLQTAKKLGFSSVKDLKPAKTTKKKKVNPSGAKKRRVSNSKVSELLCLLESQDYRCALSGVKLIPEESNLDHKVPLSRDGNDDISNLQWLDKRVNAAKGAMTNDEFLALCRKVVSWSS